MKRKAQRAKARFERRDLKLDDLMGIVTRAKAAPLNEADYSVLTAAVEPLAFLTLDLQAKGASIDRLRKLVFGASTEKTSHQPWGPCGPPPINVSINSQTLAMSSTRLAASTAKPFFASMRISRLGAAEVEDDVFMV